VPEPGTVGRPIPRLRGGPGDAAPGRYESGSQGVCGVSDPDAGRVDPIAVRRRWRHHARGIAGQPVRAGRDGQRAQPGPADAFGRARASHDAAQAPRTAVGRQLLDDVVLLVYGRSGRRCL